MIGKLLGNRYEIIEEIGKGGTAIVYLAKCRILNRFVAVKVLRPEFREDSEFILRFKAEAQSAAKLSHPNIVSIYDVGSDGDLDYIVMEFVEGVTLKQYIQAKGVLPWKEAVDYAAQICSGLEHAHKKGIIHKDIKPQNVIMTKEGILKITDFGIARAVNSGTVTVGGTTLGSVQYLSPEQARGGYVDVRTDLYSLGVVLYEMVTGQLPFQGDTPVSIAIQHLEKQPTPPSQINPSIPLSLDEVILKAMSKEQSRRYDMASKLLIDLKKVYLGAPVHREEETYGEGDTAYVPVVNRHSPVGKLTAYDGEDDDRPKRADDSGDKPEKRKTDKRDRRSMILGVVSGVVLVAVATFLFLVFSGRLFSPGEDVALPDFRGLTVAEAQQLVQDTKLRILKDGEEYSTEYERDQIIRQDPSANMTVKGNAVVKVVVSQGAEGTKVPDLLNLKIDDAQRRLSQNDLTAVIELEANDSIPENYVIRQNPAANTSVDKGSSVTLYVSKGKSTQTVRVPNLIGLTESAAKEMLLEKGLTYGSVRTEYSAKPAGTVSKQSIHPDTEVAQKTSVDFVVSLGAEPSASPSAPPSDEPSPKKTEEPNVDPVPNAGSADDGEE